MALLHNRPLALACILLVCATFLSLFLGTWFSIALFILSGILFIVLLTLSYKKPVDHRRLTLFLIAGALLLSSFRVAADHVFVKSAWEDKTGTTVVAELRVKEIRSASAHHTELYVDAVTLDGDRMTGSAVLRAESALSLCEGDRIRTVCDVRPLDFESEHKSMPYTYRGDGARSVLIVRNGIVLEKSGTSSPRAFLAQLRAMLSHRILSACGEKEGGLLSAMLLGTRSSLPSDVSRNFTRSGVSHLLALSGLHLSLIVLLLDRFLLLFHMTKRKRIPVVLIVCGLYLLLTGFGYSMMRAIFMLFFVFLAFFAREEQDGITSLCFSAAIMLLITPNAIFSTSFRLTFLATLGILIVAELTENMPRNLPKRGMKRQMMRAVYAARASLLVSLGSLFAILIIQWLTFGEMSLMTPIANLLLVPLAPALLVSAMLTMILPLAPIGLIAALPARLLLFLTELFAKPRAMLSLEFDFVPFILIPLFLVTIVLLLIDLGKHRAVVCIPAAVGVCAFAACLAITGAIRADRPTLIYHSVYGSEGFVLTQNGKALVCDSSDGSNTVLSSYMNTVREEDITEIEVLMLTHYHEEHVYSVSRLCRRNMVRTLLLPMPITEADASVMTRIMASAKADHVAVSVYHHGTQQSLLGGVEITAYTDLYRLEQAHRPIAVNVKQGERTICYHTATHLPFENHVCDADTLLLGAHGASTAHPIILDGTYGELYLCDEVLRSCVYTPNGVTCKTLQHGRKFKLSP